MISRRDLIAGIPTGLAALQQSASAQQAGGRPNFIVIVSDDHGYEDLGCQGAKDVKTPNFDALAASGAHFQQWYAGAPVCAPSRASLMTGRYPIRCGLATNGLELKPSELTIAQLLKKGGYKTAAIGKWHLGSSDDTCPNAHGFDYFYGFHSGCVDFFSHRYYWGEPKKVNYHDLWRNRTEIFEDGTYLTEALTREAKKFITEHQREPFFLYLAYNAVHYPMHAPEKYKARFQGLEKERQTYVAMLSAMDDGIGEVLSTLKQLGLRDNTFIHYQADNGATREARAGLNGEPGRAGSNGVLRGNKFSLFDGGMHVPAMMSWPKVIPAGQKIKEVGIAMDVLPTFCKAAGVALPTDRTYDGFNFLPVVTQKAKSPHEAVFWSNQGQLATRQGQWKLVENGKLFDGSANQNKSLEGEDSLFLSDLSQDPGEKVNLRRKHPEIVDRLSTSTHKWVEEVKKN
jgi:arylsulfatase A-like enzyme